MSSVRLSVLLSTAIVAAGANALTYTASDLGSGGAVDRFGAPSIVTGLGNGRLVMNLNGHGLLSAGTNAPVYLSDAGYMSAQAFAISNGHIAGRVLYTQRMYEKFFNAAYWSRADAATRNLDPYGFYLISEAYGVDGTNVVGYGMDGFGASHALYWPNAQPILTGNEVVDLSPDPNTYSDSWAYGISGTLQVGKAQLWTGGGPRALVWNGTAASALDLTPPHSAEATAFGVSGLKIVGYFAQPKTGKWQAGMWVYPNTIVRNLTPAGYDTACLVSAKGGYQAGWATLPGGMHRAMVWNGGRLRFTDLHALLPAGFAWSEADCVFTDGSVGGFAVDASGICHAVLWKATL